MTKTEATAEVFWTAFSVLPSDEKRAVIQRIIQKETLRRDLKDLTLIEERRSEPARPLREYLQKKSGRGWPTRIIKRPAEKELDALFTRFSIHES